MKDKPTVDVSSSLRSPPLVEPDRRFYRIRLSEVVHRSRYRGHPLRTATQCPLKRAPLSRRCYLPQGSHRTVLRFAVHIDQVRPLRSSPVVMTGQRVVQASPVCHRVCFGPVLAAFAIRGVARRYGVCVNEAHSMRLTFVADCSFDLRLLSTCPHGHAVAAPFSAIRPNWPDETCTHGWLVFGIAPTEYTEHTEIGLNAKRQRR